jgi:hypothetical protein
MLLRNWHGHATVPSRVLYPHQWSWDSASSRSDSSTGRRAGRPRAALHIRGSVGRRPGSLHRLQPRDPRQGYFPGPSFGRSDDVDGHPPIDTSGIIQPPLHAVAAGSTLLPGHLASDFVFGDFRGDALVGVCGIGFRSILMRHRSQIGQPLASAQV